MSRNRQEQAEASLQAEAVSPEMERKQAETDSPETGKPETAPETAPENEAPPGDPSDATPVPGGQSQGGEKKAEQDRHQKMTADQYIRRVYLDAGIGELVWRLYRTEIMSFEEWEDKVKTLLKKKVR
jgi:hypothetical protein